MAWQELSITVPHEFVEPISYLFGRYGKGLSTELAGKGQVLLRTYIQPVPDSGWPASTSASG